HYPREDLLGRLHQALGPTRLLRFEAVHVHRQFRSAFNLRQIQKSPALELCAIRKVGVFGQRIVLPTTGIFDRSPAPNSGGAVEIEEGSSPRACAMLNHEMTVEQDRFNLSQE